MNKHTIGQAERGLQVSLKLHELENLLSAQRHASGLCLAAELLTRYALNTSDCNSHVSQSALQAVTGSMRSELETLGSMIDELMAVAS